MEGNKFHTQKACVIWETGTNAEIAVAREEAAFRNLLSARAVGFMADELAKLQIYNRDALRKAMCNYGNVSVGQSTIEQFVYDLNDRIYSRYTKRFIFNCLYQLACMNDRDFCDSD